MKIEHHESRLKEQLIRSLTPETKLRTVAHTNPQLNLQGESPSVIEGAKLIKENGYTLDADSLKKLQAYMESETADTESKLSAISLALQKKLPLKESLLNRIELNSGLSLLDFLPEQENTLNHARKNRKEDSGETNQPPSSDALKKNENLLTKLFSVIEDMSANNSEPKLFEDANKTLNPDSVNEKNLLMELAEQDLAADQVSERTNPAQELQDFLLNLEGFETEFLPIPEQAFGLQEQNKKYFEILELKVTDKLIALKEDFRSLKSVLSISLYKVTDERSDLSKSDKLNLLSKMVDSLDSAIMKSEMSLYMSLKGERELLKISSELQIARKHLEQGNLTKTESILKTVKEKMDALTFEPTLKKAYAVLGGIETKKNERTNELEAWMHESMDRFAASEKSASSLTAYLRKLGMNHEAEQFQQMQPGKEGLKQLEAKDLHTLKESLLKLTEGGSPSKDGNKATKLLHYIEGGQLKNKISDEKALQTVELELPIKLDGRIRNVKVFIKSPQHKLKLDWENFDLFFVLNSEKLGKLGIKVSAVQRQISVKLINDKSDRLGAEQKIDEHLKEDLEQLGYHLFRVLVEAWKTDAEQKDSGSKANSAPALNALSTGIGENNSSRSKIIDIKI
ncbi:MAG: hypothetical protein Q4A72_07445 [Bacillota bacterium]|nr:hypothetical protein [Bacillota bacterium]